MVLERGGRNMKPKKSKTLSQLTKEADKVFSRAIRLRDGEIRGGVWVSQCITCDAWRPLTTMHAGHFQSRRFKATRWDEENVNAQCAGCNMFGSGEQYKYGLALDLKYGDGTAKKLVKKAHQVFKVKRDYLEDVIADAKTEIKWYEDSLINKDNK